MVMHVWGGVWPGKQDRDCRSVGERDPRWRKGMMITMIMMMTMMKLTMTMTTMMMISMTMMMVMMMMR